MIMRSILKAIIDSFISFTSLFVRSEQHPGERRILILRKDGLGDCLLFYPTLSAYREFYKDAKITLVFPSIFKPLAPLLSDIDEVIWFDHGAFRNYFAYRKSFMHDLKRKGYDVVLYPVFSKEKIAERMLKTANAPTTVTFDDVLTKEISEFERNLDFAEHITGTRPEIKFPTLSTSRLHQKDFNLPHRYVIVFPGTSFATYRRWPNERFAAIIETLLKHNLVPVLCGSSKEKEITTSIIGSLAPSSKERVIDLAGMTDFADMAHLLEKAEFYFGSDTGILHLAVAVGTPAIGIIGSGGYRRFFPYGDLAKNRAVFDPPSMKGAFPIGTWDGAEKLAAGEIHPSILNITTEAAGREIDYMIEFLYQKPYEKTH